MTEFRLDAEMMERAARAAAARSSPVIIMPDGTEYPLLLFAIKQLITDQLQSVHNRDLIEGEAEDMRNSFCATLGFDPKDYRYTWETDQHQPSMQP
jgi:hypothetical protein